MDRSTDLWELPSKLRAMVERELEGGENIVWLGQPNPRARARGTLPILLFAIPWTAFALFWMAGAAGFKVPNFQQGDDFFFLFGIPFVLIGVAMLSAPLWSARTARRTAYLVTDRRVLMFEGGWGTTGIRSFFPTQLTRVSRNERVDGSGDVILDQIEKSDSDGDRRRVAVGFLGISNVREVELLVRELAQKTA